MLPHRLYSSFKTKALSHPSAAPEATQPSHFLPSLSSSESDRAPAGPRPLLAPPLPAREV